MFELREFNTEYGQHENKLIGEDAARALLLEKYLPSTVDWVISQLKADTSAQASCDGKGVLRYVHE